MFEQLPPHDIQAEESVIASLMVDSEAVLKVGNLHAADFFREANAWTFDACVSLFNRSETINQVTVAHELDRRGRLEDVGGLSFLSELILNLPTPVGVEHYAGIVKRDSTYRQMISAAMSIAQIAYQGDADLDGGNVLARVSSAGTSTRRAISPRDQT